MCFKTKTEAVTNLTECYLGVWHEIARIDFKHEEGLNNVSAQYTLDDNGNVHVLNSGYNYEKRNGKSRRLGKFQYNIAELKPFSCLLFGSMWWL